MKVQNTGRILIAKSVELERDVKPGEVTTIKPGFEQSERVLAMLHTGSLTAVVEGVKTANGATVAVSPGTESPFDNWGKDLPMPKLATEVQQMQEKIEAELPGVVEVRNSFVEDVVAITSTLLSEEQKTNILANPPAQPKVESIDELMVFLEKRGNARCRFVEQMTDLKALRAALASNSRPGATRDALKVRIEKLSSVPEKCDL
jgi:hypothetical protein